MLVVQRVFRAKRTNLREKYDYPDYGDRQRHGYSVGLGHHLAQSRSGVSNGNRLLHSGLRAGGGPTAEGTHRRAAPKAIEARSKD